MRNETFGRLLRAGIGSIATCEGKTAPAIEDELGATIGLAAASIQRYKAGHLPPERRTIEILAEACVCRGLLSREWLQKFLHAAGYHAPESLIERLRPGVPIRPRPTHIYQNLPAPTYSQFIMREQAFADIIDGLGKRSAAVLLVGFGGNGKTSLAREVTAHCLKSEDGTPQFDAAVWVSDKDRPGTTNLSVVLDEIARTLDYPGFTQFEHDEKCREVDQLLRRQRVLVVVDNFETTTDGALLSWLLNLPEPSKALITTREYRREFRRSSWPVDLRGMTEAEARELIAERVHVLKIEKLVGDLTQLDPLLAATGGNPKAIEMTMGLLKYERRPLQQIIDDLYAARGELFDDLFARAWALLDEAARRVLLAATLFPDTTNRESLAATADVQGFAFDRAVERLTDLAILDVHQVDLNSMVRYDLHPLVRAFTIGRRSEQPDMENAARQRWVRWYVDLLRIVGYPWNDLGKLALLDPERQTIYAVLEWTFANQRYAEMLRISRDLDYYNYVRGYWDKNLSIALIHAEAACKIDNPVEEARGLANHVRILSRQGKTSEAEKFVPRLRDLLRSTALSADTQFGVQHTLALYALACHDLATAYEIWQRSMENIERLSLSMQIENRQWLATCLYEMGELDQAKRLLGEALHDALQHKYTRGSITIQIKMATIDLMQGNLEDAAAALQASSTMTSEFQVRRRVADLQLAYARLYRLRGNLGTARTAANTAVDLFERLGMRRELAEARQELARIESTIAVSAEPAQA